MTTATIRPQNIRTSRPLLPIHWYSHGKPRMTDLRLSLRTENVKMTTMTMKMDSSPSCPTKLCEVHSPRLLCSVIMVRNTTYISLPPSPPSPPSLPPSPHIMPEYRRKCARFGRFFVLFHLAPKRCSWLSDRECL